MQQTQLSSLQAGGINPLRNEGQSQASDANRDLVALQPEYVAGSTHYRTAFVLRQRERRCRHLAAIDPPRGLDAVDSKETPRKTT